jgi:radical SAM superfamily enzyme YgiQ (UPF0313 family)
VDYERKYIEQSDYTFTPATAEIITSRGCPYRCAFCSSSHLFGRWRGRSPQNMIDELDFLRTRYPKVESFLYMDDHFALNRKRVIEFCQLLIERGLNRYPWDCNSRVEHVDREMLGLMAKAGCRRIGFGIESGSPEILKNIGKKISLEKAEESIEMARKAGIEAFVFFMIGHPGETMETIDMSVQAAKKLKSNYTIWSVTQVYPGTELARLQPVDNWVEYVYQPEIDKPSKVTHPCIPVFLPDGFTRETLKETAIKVIRRSTLHHARGNSSRWLGLFLRSPLSSAYHLYKALR